MANHYREAERLFPPKVKENRFIGLSQSRRPMDPAIAQVHATLAVADQLAKIAGILEKLVGGQDQATSE